jgi:uncharacterized protein YjiS (DUF1127 family)
MYEGIPWLGIDPLYVLLGLSGNHTADKCSLDKQARGRTISATALLFRIVASWRKWRRVARTRAALARLDDHQLQDIGLKHWEPPTQPRAARQTFPPPPFLG